MELQFQILSNPINLHHRDNMYFVIMATILMHNMVEARVEQDEVEEGSMYDIVDGGPIDTETEPGDDGDD